MFGSVGFDAWVLDHVLGKEVLEKISVVNVKYFRGLPFLLWLSRFISELLIHVMN